MTEQQFIQRHFDYLGKPLIDEILAHSSFQTVPAKTELIREGQYIKVIPIVLSGLVKVSSRHEDKELLLYYIQSEQSCIMSFSSCIHHEKSKIVATTETECTLLLLPADQLPKWMKQYPNLNLLFFKLYDLRYTELVDTINHLIHDKLDTRILDYLKEKTQLTGKNPIKISHKEIATEVGTAREVVSRIVKKMENLGVLKQHHDSIEII